MKVLVKSYARKIAFPIVAAMAIGMLSVTQANADVIASEDFESYTVGSNTVGGNGGTGWAGAWETSETLAPPLSNRIVGSAFAGHGQAASIVSHDDFLGDGANLLSREFATQTDAFYVGFTMRASAPPDGGTSFFHFWLDDGVGTGNAADANLGLGAAVNRNGEYFVRAAQSVTTNTGELDPYVPGDDQLFVIKISREGDSGDFATTTLWVNSTSELDDSLTRTRNAGTGITTMNTFHLRYLPRDGLGAPGTLDFDNLVVATSFDEAVSLATAVPEPSSLLIVAGLGFVGLVRRRRA